MPATVTVTGTRFADASGFPESGYVAFKPSTRLTDAHGNLVQSTEPVIAPVSGGVMVPQALLATDSANVAQTGWVWLAQEFVSDSGEGTPSRAYSFSLPSALGPTVDLQALRPTGSAAALITTNPMTVTGTATAGEVLTATSGSTAAWQAGGGGGGGVPASTVQAGTSFAIAPAVGVDTTYAREDHQHGTPAIPRLDQLGAPTSAVSLGSEKITSLANGSAATDAAAFGQIPTSAGSIGGLLAANNLSDVAAPATARGSLTAAKSGANSDITSLSGLTTPLSVAQGGTGSATEAFVDLSNPQTIGGIKTFSGEVVVPAPVNAGDAVTKAYADAMSLGLAVKASIQEATAAALPANTYANGASGIGATLTATANAALTVDGITVAGGDRVLVQNEAAAAHNGLYTVTATGSGSAPYVLTRTTDMNTPVQVPGAFVFVEQGTVNAGAGFVVASEGPYAIGTTAISFTQFSGAGEIAAGTGLTKSGNTIALGAPVPTTLGGTGQTTTQAAINALAGAQTSGQYLRGNGTNIVVAPIAAGDLPAGSTSTQGALQLDGTSTDIQALGTQAAGSSGLAADAKHVHPTTGLVLASQLPLSIANGGSGQTTQQAAINTLTGTQSSGTYLRSNGTNATLAAIQAADVPTLNQNTTGTAAGLSTTLAIGSGGTGQTSAQAAMNALAGATTAGEYLRGSGSNVVMAAIAAGDLPTGTTSAQGALVLDGTATDIQALGTQAAGSVGKAADAGHTHPTTGVALLTGATFTGNVSAPALIPSGLSGAGSVSRYVGATASGAPTSGTFAKGDWVVDLTGNIWVCYTAGAPGTWVELAPPPNIPLPTDYGYLAWTFDPAATSGNSVMTVNSLYLTRIEVHRPITVTNIVVGYVTAGATLTAGECFAGLYNSSGTLIGSTADQSAAWVASAQKMLPMALAGGPYTLGVGFYWGALLAQGTTGPTFERGNTPANPAGYLNSGLAASQYRVGNLNGTFTSLPSNFTPSSIVETTVQAWLLMLS